MYFHFWMITLLNVNGFSPNLVGALIFWTSALGLLMVEFRLFLTQLSASNTSIFYFQDNNFNKSQWIFTKFDVYINIVEICFVITHRQFLSYLPHDNGGVLTFQILFCSNVSQELSEAIIPMVTNASMLLKQRQTPVGPKPPNPAAGPPVVPGPTAPGMGGAANTGLGLGPNLGQPNLGGGATASSSQVCIKCTHSDPDMMQRCILNIYIFIALNNFGSLFVFC